MNRSRRSFVLAIAMLTVAAFTGTTRPVAAAEQDAAASASKAPELVLIFRHAEKPEGDEKDPHLTPSGYKRASLIPTLFLQQPGAKGLPRLPRPNAIFATDTSKHSNRPIETITPLAQALHLPINHDFTDRETAPVAKEVLSGKYAGKVVVICWHHGEIPHLAEAFGVTDAPKKWNDTVYDQIWVLEWVNGKVQFSTLPQRLLPNDSAN